MFLLLCLQRKWWFDCYFVLSIRSYYKHPDRLISFHWMISFDACDQFYDGFVCDKCGGLIVTLLYQLEHTTNILIDWSVFIEWSILIEWSVLWLLCLRQKWWFDCYFVLSIRTYFKNPNRLISFHWMISFDWKISFMIALFAKKVVVWLLLCSLNKNIIQTSW